MWSDIYTEYKYIGDVLDFPLAASHLAHQFVLIACNFFFYQFAAQLSLLKLLIKLQSKQLKRSCQG